MNKIYQIAKYTFIENLKRKNFIILFIFIAIVLGSGVLFSMLAPDQEIRMIFDLGSAAIEMFTFLSAAFFSVRMILEEIEEKTAYLILSRPTSRASYLLGRFFGVASIALSYILIMTAALTLMLLLKGWTFNSSIVGIAVFTFLKILIVISFSILLSLISTSSASSFISIFFLWGLGHFAEELKHLNHILIEAGIVITFPLRVIYYIVPNFSKLNYKDIFHIKDAFTMELFWAGGYAILYSAAVLTLAILIFQKKEL